MTRTWSASTLLDLKAYPLLGEDAPGREAVIDEARRGLAACGFAELPGFLSAEGLAAALEDACTVEHKGHRNAGPGTAYLELPDDSFSADHPRQWFGYSAVTAIAWDLFDEDSPIRWLYEWDPLTEFVADVLGRGPVFRYGDPLGGLNLASMGEGDELQWHFDQTDFVVSLAIRDAEIGGDFEVSPRIRSADDERYDAVGAVLDDTDTSSVMTVGMEPGTLLVFEGRYSLHRVSPIAGDTTRLVALFGYDTKPGTMSSDLLKLVRYGRTEPVGAAGAGGT